MVPRHVEIVLAAGDHPPVDLDEPDRLAGEAGFQRIQDGLDWHLLLPVDVVRLEQGGPGLHFLATVMVAIGTPVASIGCACIFDGIFLTGILAVLIAGFSRRSKDTDASRLMLPSS